MNSRPSCSPANKNHQRIFLAIFIELKYADHEFLGSLQPLCNKYDFSPRMLETVRSKMRRMGLIDHVSRFNKRHGYREGWVFSSRFGKSLSQLAGIERLRAARGKGPRQEQKDRGLFLVLVNRTRGRVTILGGNALCVGGRENHPFFCDC